MPNADTASAILAWRTDVTAIPFNTPVLVRQSVEGVPFMVQRNLDYEPEAVNYLLGPDASGYGVYVDIDELQAWLSVV